MRWLTDRSLRTQLLLAFGLVLALMVGQNALAYRTTVANQEAARWVEHTYRVIGLADDAWASLLLMQAAYRGYLLAGEERFLAPYAPARQAFAEQIGALQQESRDNPAQVARWQDLARRAAIWDATVVEPGLERRRAVASGQASQEEVAAHVRSGFGIEQFDAMRGVIQEAIAVERGLLTERAEAADAANARLLDVLLWGGVLTVGIGLAAAVVLAWSIAGAATRVAASAEEIAQGRLGAHIGLRRRDELGRMAAAFDRMADRLRRTLGHTDAILQTVGDGILGLDPRGAITFANPTAARLTGYGVDELVGRVAHDLLQPSGADGAAAAADVLPLTTVLAAGAAYRAEDQVFLRKAGASLPVEYVITPLYDVDQPAGAVVAFRDITERKRAEARLQQALDDLERANVELQRSNADLQQFAYVASHDLQEPLRMVASYTQLIARRYRGQLDADADEFIGYAVDGATRMQRLINDLLAYSRVNTRARPSEPTDCGQVVERACHNLRLAIEESGAVVTRDELPTVLADPGQVGQVFENLIGNAIKFRAQRPPRVHLSAERCGEEWRFAVQDNGIGIAPEYSERIFVMFQRLHGVGEYAGSGIGLAICKKIVERHGGRIGVESTPDVGTTVYFTLPATPAGAEDGP